MTSRHQDLELLNLHKIGPYKIYADEAARLADSSLTADDVGKVFQQTSPSNQFYILQNHSPMTWSGPLGVGLGEANTASNVGGEAEVFRTKSGVDLQFRTLLAGDGLQITQQDQTVTIGQLIGGGGISPFEDVVIFDHFLGGGAGYGVYPWQTYTSGAGATVVSSGIGGHPGMAVLFGGTGPPTPRASIYLGNSTTVPFRVGGIWAITYKSLFRMSNSISGTDLLQAMIGLGSDWTGQLDQANGIYFRYRPGVDTYWTLVTASGGVKTEVPSTLAPVVDDWVSFQINISSPGSSPSITGVINDVIPVGPITTNIPTLGLGIGARVEATPGTINPQLLWDYVYILQKSDGYD